MDLHINNDLPLFRAQIYVKKFHKFANSEDFMDSRRRLVLMAEQELEEFKKKQFQESGKFLWDKFPLRDRSLEVLIAASLSSKRGCKGGLVNERGQPSGLNDSISATELRQYGLLGQRESLDEFQPTELGWAMLRAFASDRARFPEQIADTEDLGGVSMYKPARSMFRKC